MGFALPNLIPRAYTHYAACALCVVPLACPVVFVGVTVAGVVVVVVIGCCCCFCGFCLYVYVVLVVVLFVVVVVVIAAVALLALTVRELPSHNVKSKLSHPHTLSGPHS